MANSYYIAACVFTSKFPELSERIQLYIKSRFDIKLLRCCVPRYAEGYYGKLLLPF